MAGKEAWLITGNDNITAPTSGYGTTINNNFIGTTNAVDVAFATNNIERMRIKSTDNANLQICYGLTSAVNLIGTGNPSILHLHDWGTTANDYSQLNISTSSINLGRIGVINFAGTQITNERRTASIESFLTAYSGGNASGDLRFSTNNNNVYAERMRLTPEGFLGLGTSSPGVATQTGRNYLTISGSTGAGMLELITQEADADNVRVGGIQFVDRNSTATDKRVAFIGSNLSGTTANNRGGNIDFWTKPDNASLTQAMIITNDGRVGIAHFTPTARLQVREAVSGGIAIRGEYSPSSGVGVGVRGQTASNDGYGVVGYNSSTSAPTTFPQAAGVFGQTEAPNSIGVWGLASNNTTSQSFGVWGETRGANSIGVVGVGNGLSSGTLPSQGAGGFFRGQTYGVYAFSSGGSGTYGLYAINTGSNGNGIFAEASVGTTAWALWARSTTGVAGYFSGNVQITGSLSKGSGSFLIDHPLDPLNKTLRHNFVESPENLCLYRGKVLLDNNGEAKVKMPDYFKALTKEEEATVILTPIGNKPFLTSYEWTEDFSTVIIYGDPNRYVSYQVLADRDDPVMKLLYKPVEEEKGNGNFEKGLLLYPKAYGYPESMSIESIREPKESY